MTFKRFITAFLVLHVTNAVNLKYEPMHLGREDSITEAFNNLIHTLEYVHDKAIHKIEYASTELNDLGNSSLLFLSSMMEYANVRFDVCREKAKEFGEHAVDRVKEDSAKINQINNNAVDNVTITVAKTLDSLETRLNKISTDINRCIEKAEKDFKVCSGVTCMLLISDLGFDVAANVANAAFAFASVWKEIAIKTQYNVIMICDNAGSEMNGILNDLEAFINSLKSSV